MFDLKNINSQEALEFLFKKTNFHKHRVYAFDDGAISMNEDYVWIGECEYMGSITVADFEDSGYDALFIQTLVQLFKDGKLKFVE